MSFLIGILASLFKKLGMTFISWAAKSIATKNRISKKHSDIDISEERNLKAIAEVHNGKPITKEQIKELIDSADKLHPTM